MKTPCKSFKCLSLHKVQYDLLSRLQKSEEQNSPVSFIFWVPSAAPDPGKVQNKWTNSQTYSTNSAYILCS